MSTIPVLSSIAAITLVAGCAGDAQDAPYDFSSDQATLLVFEFDGELTSSYVWNAESAIQDQMLYTIGHLNGDDAVGRLDKLVLSNVERTATADGRTKITYHAKLPVGWGSKTNLPTSYELTLPRHDQYSKIVEKYAHSCVDWGAHDVDVGSMWYYYRPHHSGCQLDDADVFKTTATVTVSNENTTGKYPEYHKIWEDDALTVVSIFGKYDDGATSMGDSGISAYDSFVSEMRRLLVDSGLVTVPASIPDTVGVDMPDITFRATLADGKKIEVVALLVDNVRTAGAIFDERYNDLSTDADMVFYNGHAGLGANIRALADKGTFVKGKYQIFFMNGCDTFAYVDRRLADKHAAVNPDDPTGSRHLDMVTNVMPSFFSSMPYASMSMIKGLMSYATPKTYEQIFTSIDRSEVVVVSGEEDNVYVPGFEPGGGSNWPGIDESGSLARGESKIYDLGTLPAGAYSFTTKAAGSAGGDVDLYLAKGRTPTLEDYDDRPYLGGSDESITLRLEAPTKVVLMVYGYDHANAASSGYTLAGRAVTE